jgi:lysophospholipid acyltransferase (LPLAT)-like uncharacterized protein
MHPVASRMAFLAGGPLSLLLSAWSRLTLATARLEVTGPGIEGQAIFVHWHGYLPLVMPLLGQRRAWLLTSAAPHMEAIARWAERCGLQLVRGASGENGRAALAKLEQAVAAGGSVELAVDGPAGPLHVAKPGCVTLALATGQPVVGIRYRGSMQFVTPGRWDRQVLVLPFSRVRVETFLIPLDAGADVVTNLAVVQAALLAAERKR